MNRLLTNTDRKDLSNLIEDMFLICPDMMSRKITEANVQQAFVLDRILELGDKVNDSILSVGSFECTTTEYLINMGWNIKPIDPETDYDMHTYFQAFGEKFDYIISVSVIEHVEDDELFIYEICNSLNPGGIAILTCDFNNKFKAGMPVPYSDYRLYTEYDLNSRLRKIIQANACSYLGTPDWSGEPDFVYQGHHYSFATIVFRKE